MVGQGVAGDELAVAVVDRVKLVANHSSDVSVLDLFRFYYAPGHDTDALRRFLEAPLALRFRTKIEAKLASLEQDSD